MKPILSLLFLMVLCSSSYSQTLPIVEPSEAGMNPGHLWRVDGVIYNAIKEKDIPGAVLVVVRDGKIVYRRAYGMMQLKPSHKVMEETTIFDLASITKPVATATALMILVDRGKVRLDDPISMYVPGFIPWTENGVTENPRIIHLLTHSAGLPAYAPVEELAERFQTSTPDSLMHYFSTIRRSGPPGSLSTYSCPSFITLQRVVEVVSGESLHAFTQKNIYEPLGMSQTTFRPGKEMMTSVAPTQYLENGLLIGDVHDPLANRFMGGISGNAGLFSNADDLAVFATMMMNYGEFNGTRILSPAAVRKMTTLPERFERFGRGLGWDLSSAFSTNQGDLFGPNTYGHTGYTGTSLIIDPDSKTAVILLTNRVHPSDTGSVVRLRSLIANVVAASILDW